MRDFLGKLDLVFWKTQEDWLLLKLMEIFQNIKIINEEILEDPVVVYARL